MCEQDERVERVRMALAEAGHPEAQVEWDDDEDSVMVVHRKGLHDLEWTPPHEVTWRAYRICGETQVCLDCWVDRSHQSPTCDHPLV